MFSDLKAGYTTGVHATSVLKVSFLSYINSLDGISNIDILLPSGMFAYLDILECKNNNIYSYAIAQKTNNDDIDVTKGCLITCWCSENIKNIPCNLHEIEHTPVSFLVNDIQFFIYSGKGLGVSTSDVLTLKKNYPAINKVPLDMMKNEIEDVLTKNILSKPLKTVYFVFEVYDGEEIAKQTINQKLGIIGGISFIGKTGIVKPISNDAFLHSIYAQIDYAVNNDIKNIYFTIGNSSSEYTQKNVNLETGYVIDIGNFVFDSFAYLPKYGVNNLFLVVGLGKLAKIYQGKKNTNNKYGMLDFDEFAECLDSYKLNSEVVDFARQSTTVKSIESFIISYYPELLASFYDVVLSKSGETVTIWLNQLNTTVKMFQIILLTDKSTSISKTIQI